ncbi:thiamine pyrophosphate-binding protein [bacterium]|nr:thiamine pyrophosphate-binding protein [bacterium]
MKLSDYIAKRLKEKYGVEKVFLVSGGGAMHLNNSFGKFLPYIVNHHEQASSFAAEGYSRLKQELSVVNVTTGPGGLNCLNGVFGQWTDSVPVLYISGQVKYSTMMESCPDIPLRQLGDQEADIISVVKPITKYAVTILEPNKIKYELDRAIYEALTGRFGPVWLNIPMNVQSAVIEEDELADFIPPKQSKTYDLKIEEVINKLKTAKRPLIVAGHGIRLSNTIKEFTDFIEKTGIPVVSTLNGLDILETENPHHIGRTGTIGQRAGNFALQNADVLLELGTRNNIRQVSYNWENFGKNAFKIIVDIDKAELQKPLVRPDLAIQCDLKDFMPALNKKTDEIKAPQTWVQYCQKIKEKYSFYNTKEYRQEGKELNPYYVVRKITEQISKDDIIVSANATPLICMFQAGVLKGQRVIMNSGSASMGYGLPCAIGTSAREGKRTICFEGDGSIMMNLQELETVAFNKLPIKIFLFNNNGYSSIRQTQKNFFNGEMTGSGEESGLGMPDFCRLAEGFRLKNIRISNSDELEEKIKEVLQDDEPVLFEIMIQKDYIFTPKLSSKTMPDGTIISPSLENMYPFLSEEEMRENILY